MFIPQSSRRITGKTKAERRRRVRCGRAPLLLLLLLSTLLSQSSCILGRQKVELSYVTLATKNSETTSATSAETTAQTTIATTTEPKETEFKPDYSKESKVADLSTLPIKYMTTTGSEEQSGELAGLSAALRQFLEERGLSDARLSIIYEDLSSGRKLSWRPDERYAAASVIKVAAAMVCEQLLAEGVFPADMNVCYVPNEQFSSENLDAEKLGELVSLGELISSAIVYSDNAATSVLFNFFKRHGRDLHFFMDERCGTHYAADISMSALEGLQLIEQLYANPWQVPGYQNLLADMNRSAWGQFVTAGIPVMVASKYGQIGASMHEIGLVWTDRPFAYSVFSEGVDGYQLFPALGELLYQWHQG